jgi:hypothetical protein
LLIYKRKVKLLLVTYSQLKGYQEEERVSAYFGVGRKNEWYGLGDAPGYDPNFKSKKGGKTSSFLTAWYDANEMAVVKNCCGCCDIRKGVFVVAIFNIVRTSNKPRDFSTFIVIMEIKRIAFIVKKH